MTTTEADLEYDSSERDRRYVRHSQFKRDRNERRREGAKHLRKAKRSLGIKRPSK
jgi:hypothetical protein